MHRDVGIDQADQRHVGKIETLADHLRAHEHVDLAGAKVAQHLPEPVLLRHGVGVHAFDLGAGQHPAHGLLDALGAEATPADVGRPALGAARRRRALIAA